MATTAKNKGATKAAPKTKKATVRKPVSNKAEIDKATSEGVKQATVVNRVIKYNYPENVKDPLERKSWRQKTRAKLRSMEREITKAPNKTAVKKLTTALNQYRKEVLA